MIVTRTPLRISFCGGGSDLPPFFREEPGFVVSAAIDRYIHVTVSRKFDPAIRVAYSQTENVTSLNAIQNSRVRAALAHYGPSSHVEIHSIADIPAGTGLGSSSSFTVGLILALHAHRGDYITSLDLAHQACTIELHALGEPIGIQDQWVAAMGGLKAYTFHPDGMVGMEPLDFNAEVIETLNAHLLLLHTDLPARDASTILKEQSRMDGETRARTRWLTQTAREFAAALCDGNIAWCGELMHVAWTTKRQLATRVSSPTIDAWYEAAVRAGAWGGKLCGAGGGGFLAFLAPWDRHDAIIKATGLRAVPVRLGVPGAEIVYADKGASEWPTM